MSEQKRSTPQRSDAPTQRRRSNASPRRRSSRRGGMPQWLSGWIEHMALFFSTLGARIRRIGPRARTVMRESRARNFPESNRFLDVLPFPLSVFFCFYLILHYSCRFSTPFIFFFIKLKS